MLCPYLGNYIQSVLLSRGLNPGQVMVQATNNNGCAKIAVSPFHVVYTIYLVLTPGMWDSVAVSMYNSVDLIKSGKGGGRGRSEGGRGWKEERKTEKGRGRTHSSQVTFKHTDTLL